MVDVDLLVLSVKRMLCNVGVTSSRFEVHFEANGGEGVVVIRVADIDLVNVYVVCG